MDLFWVNQHRDSEDPDTRIWTPCFPRLSMEPLKNPELQLEDFLREFSGMIH